MQADSSERPTTRALRLGGAAAAQEMVPAGARARVLVLSALAALPAGAGPAGLPKQPLPKLLAATDAAHDSLAPPGTMRASLRQRIYILSFMPPSQNICLMTDNPALV